jgi:hypothetical protein
MNLRQQNCILFGTRTAEFRSALLGGMATITRRGDLQHSADRLDPEGIAMLVDEFDQDLSLRSSSAWAKKALASFRISLARRSSLFSRVGAD